MNQSANHPTGLPRYTINDDLLQARSHIRAKTLGQLFDADSKRAERFSLETCGLYLDYSKNFIDQKVFDQLVALTAEMELPAAIESLFRGGIVNVTEDRPALHTALRDSSEAMAGADISEMVRAVLAQMVVFANQLRQGECSGYSDRVIDHIVVLGIGGSYLGPKLVCEALKDFNDTDVTVEFVASMDPAELIDVLNAVNPEKTLFIVSSKSFTTHETLSNAKAVKTWLLNQGCPEKLLSRHFAGVTANQDEARKFGISKQYIFQLWDWVGGRYSLWSAIGLPILLAVGERHFKALLKGARTMDEHFRAAPFDKNMPVILALLGVWQRNYLGLPTHAVLPYSYRLRSLTDHLQQLEMESNGKSVDSAGITVPHDTAPVVWGGMGNNGQHAFYQLLHQGTQEIAVDFILPSKQVVGDDNHQLAARAFAQAEALMQGRTSNSETGAIDNQGYRMISGNKASNMLLMDSLNPECLGSLLALYEHKAYVQGVCWKVNSFDQWGVELGKHLASQIERAIEGDADIPLDNSTRALVERLHRVSSKER